MDRVQIADALRLTIVRLDLAPNDPAVFRCRRIADAIELGTLAAYGFTIVETIFAIRELTGEAEESALPEAEIDLMRDAHFAACDLLGQPWAGS